MKGWRFWAIWSPLVLLALTGLFHHEMWLDEMHHWLLARDSASLPALPYNARFESHPLLWNALLWAITQFTADPFYMQLLHGCLVTGAMALWVRYAPFPWYILLLGGLGYFLLYEYAALSRNYLVGVLGLFVAAAAIRRIPCGLGWIALGCLLASYSHLLFLIPAIVLFAYAWLRHWQQWSRVKRMVYTGFFAVLLVPAIYWCIPHSEHTYLQFDSSGLFSWACLEGALHYLTEAIIPIPDFTQNLWWNSNWLENRIDQPLLYAPLGIVLFAVLLVSLQKDPLAMLFFGFSAAGIVGFAWLSEMQAVRYTGPIWISYLVAWWISTIRFRWNWTGWLLLTLLFIHAIGGVLAWQTELRKPFSQGKAAASYIQTHNLEELPIYSFPECAALVTIGYLGSSACYPQTSICGSYCHWPEIPRNQQVEVFWRNLKKEQVNKKGPALLLLNRPLPPDLKSQVEPLKMFTDSQVYFGDVYLYRYPGSNRPKR